MLRTLALLGLLLGAACGGGGNRGFQPSGNLDVSHPFLLGDWHGWMAWNDGTQQWNEPAEATIEVPPGTSSTAVFDWTLRVGANREGFMACDLYADGALVRVEYVGSAGWVTKGFLGLSEGSTRLAGTLTRTMPNGTLVGEYAVDVRKQQPQPALVDVVTYETPDLLMQVRIPR